MAIPTTAVTDPVAARMVPWPHPRRPIRVERSFEHTLDRGGLHRTYLRGRENVQKRYLVHVAGFNLGLVMRALLGAGTPKELATRGGILLWLIDHTADLVLLVILPPEPHQDHHELRKPIPDF